MATIKDVAKKAGVSVATVSRMMNNRVTVSEKTRKKINRAIRELDYKPNAMARALQTRKSDIIGLIVPVIDYAYFSCLTDAVEEACHAHGYKLMLCRSSYDEEREREMVSLLQANKVDGILLCSHVGDAGLYTKVDLPIVCIDRELETLPSVTADNYSGGAMAARVLESHGSRHALLLSSTVPAYMPMYRRHQGFQEECAKLGMACTEFSAGELPITEEKQDELLDFLEGHPEIDGIFATSDMLALYFLRRFRQRHRQWAHPVPLVGFDGLEIGAFMGLSTIAQPVRDMGTCAVELLIQKIEGKNVPIRSTLAVTCIERESTLDV